MNLLASNNEMQFIEDDNGHRLPYHSKLADDPENAPILVSFHGWLIRHRQYQTSAHTQPFTRNDWNYITPQDRYGLARGGCWYLGENGDFFFIKLIDRLIESLRQQGLHGPLYFHGTSMGGFGALLHGLRLGVKAVCVSVPQVRLLGTELHQEWTRAIEAVFGKASSDKVIYSDVTHFINTDSPQDNPVIFITQSAMDVHRHYVQEQALYLANKLADAGTCFYLKIVPEQAHIEYVKPDQAIALFDEYSDAIENPIRFSTEQYEQDMAEIDQLI